MKEQQTQHALLQHCRLHTLPDFQGAPIDPADWPALCDAIRTELVSRRPYQTSPDFTFPKRDDGRSCHYNHFYRKLVNGLYIQRKEILCIILLQAHTLNLVVADAAKSSTDAINYFGYLQIIFTLFSASTQRWTILKHHIKTTVKSWSDTRWESRINSVKALRFQTAEVKDALLEVREKATDSMFKTEAQSLADKVGSYSICSFVTCRPKFNMSAKHYSPCLCNWM